MSGRVLYLAEPIDQSDHGAWKESVLRALKLVTERGWLAYRPSGAWRVGPGAPVGPEIEMVNRYILAHSRAVIAYMPSGVPSVGVPREVEWAVLNSIPVLVMTDRPGWSLYDVDTAAVDDIPALGQWIVAVEEQSEIHGHAFGFEVMEGGQLPTRANPGDAGYDLYVSRDTKIDPGEFVDVPCGVRVALPPGVWARITGRSSTLRKRGLQVQEGIIDNGYRGPLYSGVFNLGEETKVVKAGERLAQLILHENVSARFRAVEVDSGMFARIPGDSRGEAGFGSTGE